MPEVVNAPASQRLQLSPEDNARIDAVLADLQARRVAKADGEGVAPLSDRSQAALKAVYRILLPHRGEITEDDIDELLEDLALDDSQDPVPVDADVDAAGESIQAAAKAATNTTAEGACMATSDDKAEKAAGKMPWDTEPDDADKKKKHAAAKAAALKAFNAAMDDDEDAKANKAADSEDDEDGDEAKKSVTKAADALPPETRAYFDAIQKKAAAERAALVEKSVALETQLHALMEEKAIKGHEAVLKSACGDLPIDVPKTARVLKSLAAIDQAAHDDYLATLKAANQACKVQKAFGGAGLYSVMGHSPGVSGQLEGATAEQKLEAMVNGVVAKSSGKCAHGDALRQVLATEEGLALYIENAEQAKRGGR